MTFLVGAGADCDLVQYPMAPGVEVFVCVSLSAGVSDKAKYDELNG